MYERVKDRADNMMMAIVVEVGECTSFTVISCPFVKQTSTPSGSQPLALRARHLPLPHGTAIIMFAHSRGIYQMDGRERAHAWNFFPAPERTRTFRQNSPCKE